MSSVQIYNVENNKSKVKTSPKNERCVQTFDWYCILLSPLAPSLTQHSLSQSSQFHVCALEGLLQLFVHGLLFALEQDGGASVQDPLWRPLHHPQVDAHVEVLCVMNGQLVT